MNIIEMMLSAVKTAERSGDPLMQDQRSGQSGRVIQFPARGTFSDIASAAANDADEEQKDKAQPSSSQVQRSGTDGSVVSLKAMASGITNISTTIQSGIEQESLRDGDMVALLRTHQKSLGQISETMTSLYDLLYKEANKLEVDVYQRKHRSMLDAANDSNGAKDSVQKQGTLFSDLFGGIASVLGGTWVGKKLFGNKTPDVDVGSKTPAGGKPPSSPTPAKAGMWQTIKGKASGLVETIAKSRKGRVLAGVLTAAGAYGGYKAASSYLGDYSKRAGEHRDKSFEEIVENAKRVEMGMKPMEGEELIAFRTAITQRSGQIANPSTGLPLNGLQESVVTKGLLTPEQAVATDNIKLKELLNRNGYAATSSEHIYDPNNVTGSSEGGGTMSSVAAVASLAAGGYAYSKLRPGEPTVGGATGAKAADLPDAKKIEAPKAWDIKPPADAKATMQKVAAANQAAANDTKAPARSERAKAAWQAELDKQKAAKLSPKPNGFLGKIRGVPLLGTALTALEAGSIVTDDKLTTGQKAGELTDLAGGLAGAAAGGKAGAAAGAAIGSFFFGAGAIPGAALGGLIGSVGGFFLGEKVTEGARETVFGGNDDPEAVVSPAKNEAQEKLRKKYFENDRDNYGSTADYALGITKAKRAQMDAIESEAKKREHTVGAKVPGAGNEKKHLAGTSSGVDTFLTATMKAESGGRAGAVSDTGATGLYQFTMGTWNDLTDRFQRKLQELGVTPRKVTPQNRGTPNDPRLDTKAQHAYARVLTESNARTIGSQDPGALYLAHFLGAGAAKSIVQAVNTGNGDANAYSLLPSAVQKQIGVSATNKRIVMGRTADELLGWASEKMTKGGALAAATSHARTPVTSQEEIQAKYGLNAPQRTPSAPSVRGPAASSASRPKLSASAEATIASNSHTASPLPDDPNDVSVEAQAAKGRAELSAFQVRSTSSPAPVMSGAEYSPTRQTSGEASSVQKVSQSAPVAVSQPQDSATSVQSRAVHDTPPKRESYESVQKVMMIDPNVKKESKISKMTKEQRIGSRGTYASGSTHPRIDESPVVVSDYGLVLLNTGFI